MNLQKHIPNLFTLVNALCGGLAVVFINQGDIDTACLLIVLAAVFDFFDGFVARAFHATSDLGKELDSLSDVISFGLVPALMAFKIYQHSPVSKDYGDWVGYVIIIMVPLSAYRLGKFNLDTRQSTSFLGLPTPANGLLWVALAQIYFHYHTTEGAALASVVGSQLCKLMDMPFVVPVVAILLSLMLISEIPLFAMKFKGFKWQGNEVKFIFIILSLLLLIVLRVVAAPFIFALYIILSIIQTRIEHRHELRS